MNLLLILSIVAVAAATQRERPSRELAQSLRFTVENLIASAAPATEARNPASRSHHCSRQQIFTAIGPHEDHLLRTINKPIGQVYTAKEALATWILWTAAGAAKPRDLRLREDELIEKARELPVAGVIDSLQLVRASLADGSSPIDENA